MWPACYRCKEGRRCLGRAGFAGQPLQLRLPQTDTGAKRKTFHGGNAILRGVPGSYEPSGAGGERRARLRLQLFYNKPLVKPGGTLIKRCRPPRTRSRCRSSSRKSRLRSTSARLLPQPPRASPLHRLVLGHLSAALSFAGDHRWTQGRPGGAPSRRMLGA